jgi:hypothetical protein
MLTYNKEQIIFFLSMLANVEETIQLDLNNPTVKAQIGDWSVVWGPIVYYHDPKVQAWDNVMYVAKGTDPVKLTPVYVIAIAGTNPKSVFDWFFEDFDTKNTVNWSNTQPETGTISQGTQTGLKILQNMRDQSTNLSLLEFLSNEIKTQTVTEIEVITTGHSLGGALSPVFGLWLSENQNIWNSQAKNITLSTQYSAGATPGDQTFATYFDNTDLGKNHTNRIWNSLDIVPHAWNKDQLAQIPKLYQQCSISVSSRVLALVKAQIYRVKATNYQHINKSTAALEGQCSGVINKKNNDLKQFLQEAYFQHIKAYFNLMKVDSLPKESVVNSLNLTDQDLENIATKLSIESIEER